MSSFQIKQLCPVSDMLVIEFIKNEPGGKRKYFFKYGPIHAIALSESKDLQHIEYVVVRADSTFDTVSINIKTGDPLAEIDTMSDGEVRVVDVISRKDLKGLYPSATPDYCSEGFAESSNHQFHNESEDITDDPEIELY